MTAFLYIYNNLSVLFYLFQKQLYVTLISRSKYFYVFKFLSLFFIGILTSITPCFLSVIPLLLSYINFFNISFLRKITFYFGLLSSFVLIIIVAYYGGNGLRNIFASLPIFTAIFFIILGLNLLGIFNFSININDLKLSQANQLNVLIQSYFLGYFIGLSALPCNASLMLTTVLWLSNLGNNLQSLIYLIIYILGFLCPFIIVFYIPVTSIKMQQFIYLWNLLISLLAFIILSTNFFILFKEVL